MKKIISLTLICLMAVLGSGCYTSTGQVTYDFIKENKVVIYKVVKNGVLTFMTKEQIEDKQFDKAGAIIEYAYSLSKDTGKVVE